MPTPDFQHIRLSMVGDIALVEILTKDLQGPKRAVELGTELRGSPPKSGRKRIRWSTSAGPATSAVRGSPSCSSS